MKSSKENAIVISISTPELFGSVQGRGPTPLLSVSQSVRLLFIMARGSDFLVLRTLLLHHFTSLQDRILVVNRTAVRNSMQPIAQHNFRQFHLNDVDRARLITTRTGQVDNLQSTVFPYSRL